MIEAAANRIATPNAATPRYGQCNRQALQFFELLACNVKTFLLGDQKGAILFCEREWPPLPRAALAALLSPPRGALRRSKLREQINDLRKHEKRRLNA